MSKTNKYVIIHAHGLSTDRFVIIPDDFSIIPVVSKGVILRADPEGIHQLIHQHDKLENFLKSGDYKYLLINEDCGKCVNVKMNNIIIHDISFNFNINNRFEEHFGLYIGNTIPYIIQKKDNIGETMNMRDDILIKKRNNIITLGEILFCLKKYEKMGYDVPNKIVIFSCRAFSNNQQDEHKNKHFYNTENKILNKISSTCPNLVRNITQKSETLPVYKYSDSSENAQGAAGAAAASAAAAAAAEVSYESSSIGNLLEYTRESSMFYDDNENDTDDTDDAVGSLLRTHSSEFRLHDSKNILKEKIFDNFYDIIMNRNNCHEWIKKNCEDPKCVRDQIMFVIVMIIKYYLCEQFSLEELCKIYNLAYSIENIEYGVLENIKKLDISELKIDIYNPSSFNPKKIIFDIFENDFIYKNYNINNEPNYTNNIHGIIFQLVNILFNEIMRQRGGATNFKNKYLKYLLKSK
jgi:hypothetical protein